MGTVASAPLMFTSAMMFGMQVFTMDVNSVLNQTILDVAVVALICCVSFLLILVSVCSQSFLLSQAYRDRKSKHDD